MNRTTSVFGLITLTSIVAFSPNGQAQGNDTQLLKTRVSALESRVAVLENAAATGIATVGFTTAPAPPTSQEPESYVIKEGDTISEIARRMNIPRSLLMEENGLREGQQIYIGDSLAIPIKPETASSAKNIAKTQSAKKPAKTNNAGGHTFYTVKYGDTLSKISRKTGVSVASIKSANGLKNDIIGGGQRLKIPANGSAPKTQAPSTSTKLANQVPSKKSSSNKSYSNPNLSDNETYGEYTVEKGDNLYALARDFFTTMKELQQLNGLGGSTLIYPGHKIIVPTSKYNEYHNKVASR